MTIDGFKDFFNFITNSKIDVGITDNTLSTNLTNSLEKN